MRGIDLFSGGGCGSVGARHAGVTMVGAVDSWKIAADTYKDNFPDAKVVTCRLHDRSGPEIFGRLGKIDLLIASPECTNHSIARGNKPVNEESQRSGWYVTRFIKELAPRWIVLENVTPMRFWPGFDDLIAIINREYHLRIVPLDAADFGVPQNRRRLFIIGDRMREPAFPYPTVRMERPASCIIEATGRFTANPVYGEGRAAATIKRVERGISELGRNRDFLIVYYGSDRAGGWQPLDRPLRTLTTLDRFGLVQWIGKEPTLRMLQVPELKRAMGLQGLRDENGSGIKFLLNEGTRRDQVKILGNGVCAPVMKAVVASLLGGSISDIAPSQKKLRTQKSRRVSVSSRYRNSTGQLLSRTKGRPRRSTIGSSRKKSRAYRLRARPRSKKTSA